MIFIYLFGHGVTSRCTGYCTVVLLSVMVELFAHRGKKPVKDVVRMLEVGVLTDSAPRDGQVRCFGAVPVVYP